MASTIEIATSVGDFANTSDQTGVSTLRGLVAGRWGIDETGNPYYDEQGADAGELASISTDPDGALTFAAAAGVSVRERDELGRMFTRLRGATAARSYEHDATGRLFATSRPGLPVRSYDHDPTGRLFESAARPAPRDYDRSDDGRLFPHAPIHADQEGPQ